MILTTDYKFSSNVIEVIRPILNFLFFIFFTRRFYTHQKRKTAYSKQKIKKTHKKHRKGYQANFKLHTKRLYTHQKNETTFSKLKIKNTHKKHLKGY